MDLGLSGRRAIVSAAGKGLGKACAMSLAREGVDLVLNSRTAEALEATAEEIRAETGVSVTTVAADYNTDEGRAAILERASDVDILVSNPGIRQIPGDFNEWGKDEWLYWLDVHFLSSIQMIQALVPGMRARKFGRIVNISVSFIKFPQVNFAHSHSARLALSGAIASDRAGMRAGQRDHEHGVSGLFRHRRACTPTCTTTHRRGNTTYEAIVENRLQSVPAGRFADPKECGDLVAFLCSSQAGFIVGQNIINDGGVYQGLF